MAIEIIPAVLPHSTRELEEGLEHVSGLSPWVQIDVVAADPFATLESLPHWEEVDFEFDIMAPEAVAQARRAVELGAARIIIHAAAPHTREALEALQHLRGGDYPVEVGVALRPTDSPQALAPLEGLYDYVQVMGIDREGSQGQPFDPKELDLLRALRAAHPQLVLQSDGAAAAHVRELARAGANRIIVGSALMRAADPQAVYKELYTEANGLV